MHRRRGGVGERASDRIFAMAATSVRPRREVRPQLREGRHPGQRRAVRDDLHEHGGQLPEDDVVVGPQMRLVGPRQAPVQLEVRVPVQRVEEVAHEVQYAFQPDERLGRGVGVRRVVPRDLVPYQGVERHGGRAVPP